MSNSICIIPLSQGLFATIDEEDWPLVSQYNWHASTTHETYYALAHIRRPDGTRTTIEMQRLIMGRPPGHVDHKDRDGLNNQRYNLRVGTASQNVANSKKRVGTTSRYKGVVWHKASNRWLAQITFQGRSHYLGIFLREEDAAAAYAVKAKEVFGDFSRPGGEA